MDAFIDTARRRSPIRGSMSVHVRSTLFIRMMWVSTDIDHVVAIGYVLAMLRPRTLAVLGPVIAAVVTLAVRETPASVAPSPAALPPGALIVALNGNDANPGTLTQPLATIAVRLAAATV